MRPVTRREAVVYGGPGDDHADLAGRRRSRARGRPASTFAPRVPAPRAGWSGPGLHRVLPAGRRRGRAAQRLSVTSDTAERERHLTMNRTDDGYWLLDTGGGGAAPGPSSAARSTSTSRYSPLFNTLPIRRLGLHRQPGEHTLPMVFVVAAGAGGAGGRSRPTARSPCSMATRTTRWSSFSWDDFAAELVVDADGLVISYPGVATRRPGPARRTPSAARPRSGPSVDQPSRHGVAAAADVAELRERVAGRGMRTPRRSRAAG